jgi:hypothetical protein
MPFLALTGWCSDEGLSLIVVRVDLARGTSRLPMS